GGVLLNKYISFDIGGTKVKHTLMLEDGTFITKDEYNTRKSSLEHFLEDIFCIINSYQEFDDISGVAIIMPGFVDISTGYADASGDVKNLMIYQVLLLV